MQFSSAACHKVIGLETCVAFKGELQEAKLLGASQIASS